MTPSTEQCRRDRILDAAEHAFAEHGFAGASLRDIVREAKVNLATVYYYFGSKNELMEEVLRRRFDPLRQEQMDLLRELERGAQGRPLAVADILRALLLPSLQLAMTKPDKRQAVARLIGRIVGEPDPATQAILRTQYAEVRAAFLRALQHSLPKIPTAGLRWRLEFVSGALAFIMCNPRKLERETHGACNPVDADQVLAAMISFFSPGFNAPVASNCPADRANPNCAESVKTKRRRRAAG